MFYFYLFHHIFIIFVIVYIIISTNAFLPTLHSKSKPTHPPHHPQVVSYIYFTRIIVYLLDATLPFRLAWVSAAANEAAALAFYVACGLQFQPHPHGANPYFALDQEELEMQSAARERAAA